MSVEVPGFKQGITKANIDLSTKQFRFVKPAAGVAFASTVCAVLGEASSGVLQNKPQINESAEIMSDGITKTIAGAAIAAGARVMTDANGAAITLATSGSIGQGFALEAAGAASEIIAVQLLRVGQVP